MKITLKGEGYFQRGHPIMNWGGSMDNKVLRYVIDGVNQMAIEVVST